MSTHGAVADALRGMRVTTTPESAWGSGHARLHADIVSLGRLDPDRPTATDRLQRVLGAELTQKLIFALTRGAARFVNAA